VRTSYCMGWVAGLRKCWYARGLLELGLVSGTAAQISDFLPEIDAYYRSLPNFAPGCRRNKPMRPTIL
jgi:hypothetical protein